MSGSQLLQKMGIGCVVGLVLAYVVSIFSPKVYEARADLVLMGSTRAHNTTALGAPLETQLSLLRSEGVYREAYKAALRKIQEGTEKRVASQPAKPNLSLYNMYKVETDPNSGMARVRVRAYDPGFAADLANQISLIYQVIRAKADDAADKSQQRALIARAENAKKELDEAENKLQAYKTQTGSPDLNLTTQQTLSYQANLQSRLNDARSEAAQNSESLKIIQRNMRVIPKTIRDNVERAPNSQASSLTQKLNDLQGQRVDALRIYTETSSHVKAIDDQIADVQKQLASANQKPWEDKGYKQMTNPLWQGLVSQYNDSMAKGSALAAEIQNLQRNLSQVQGEVVKLPAAQQEMQRLQRTYDFALSRYNGLQQQVAELVATSTTGASEVTTMSATADPVPVAPNVPMLLLLGGGLGLMGGAIYALATKKEIKSVRTADDLERLTGLAASAVLGLPKRAEEKALKALPSAHTKPAEAYRFMALTMPPGEGAKRIMFTGVGTDAGCSSAAGQFALALACEGRPTLLVDCDFRDSALTHVFDSVQKPGLSDILRKTILPSQDNDVQLATQHANLLFLPSGSSGDGSIADFSHSQLKAAIDMLTERADIVVFDTPPCDVVTDAVRLCPLVDEVYLVVAAEDTESAKVNMAHRMLQRCGAKTVHVMLTGTNPDAAPFSAA
jgi:succinoglycan biosynthesis transport protein ExoP